MKLFGNRKNAGFTRKKPKKTVNMPRPMRVFLTIVAIFAVLLLCVSCIKHFYVRPPSKLEQTSVQSDPEQPARELPVVTKIVTKKDEKTGADMEVEEPASHLDGVYNILLCGTDGDGYRTDTIMIGHLDVNRHTAALLSIPRDTPIDSNGRLVKINSLYANGKEAGMERLERTLSYLLGFEMDGYLLVDLNAFKAAVDLIGGVKFNVPQDMYYDDPTQDLHIDLKAGEQLLDGEHAMELVRFRKGYASQDIQRTKVQQDFLLALMEQTIRVENLSKLQEYAEIFTTYALTDLSVGNLLYFAEQLTKCDTENITTYTAEGQGATINGGSYYPLYDWSILKIVNEAFNPYDGQITSANIHVITPDLAKTYQIQPKQPEAPAEPEQTDTQPAEAETTEGGSGGITPEQPEERDDAPLEPQEPDTWGTTPSDEIWADEPATE